jgi:hypothetical protein
VTKINAFVVGTAIVFAFIGWVVSLAGFMSSGSKAPQYCTRTIVPCTVNASTSYVAWSAVDHDTTVLGPGVTQVVFVATGNNKFASRPGAVTGIVFTDPGSTCTQNDPSNPTNITCTPPPGPGTHKYTVTLKGTFSMDPWVVND